MIYSCIPVGGKGKRLKLPFSKEMLPQKNTETYIPIIDHLVVKAEQAGAIYTVFIHGEEIKHDISSHYSLARHIHVRQDMPGFAAVLWDFYDAELPSDDDIVLFGLPDTIFEGNPFHEMVNTPGIVCGLFSTSDAARVDRLDQKGETFEVKTQKTATNQKWFWGVLKFDGRDLRRMVEDDVFSQANEIGAILNRYPKSFVYCGEYLDLGTWQSLNSYWAGRRANPVQCQLTVDWAYAFDYYSILAVKYNDNASTKNLANLRNCLDELRAQLGDKLDEILKSEEYNELYEANLNTFGAVERARNDPDMAATELDQINMARHPAKAALQRRFFGSGLTEQKTGIAS